MPRDAFVLKIQSKSCRPKSFGAFEKWGTVIYGNLRAPVKVTGDNILWKENEVIAENDFVLIILSSGKKTLPQMWINHYLEGNISAIEINCVIQWIVIYPLDKTYGLFEQPGPGEIFPRFGLICWVAVVVDQKVENFAEY